ncbi:MAG: DNA internalization-related competence protein ComEC/Rec2 [Actinobacteria bacterium]|nr:DNA internalization-related competence protein ComEC/Rec2 [Actinomycetota bacterium]
MPWQTLALSLFFAAGVLAADRIRPSPVVAFAVGVLGACALTGVWMLHRKNPEPAPTQLLPRLGLAAVVGALAAAAAVGFADLGLRSAALDRSLAPRLDGRVVRIEGKAASDPTPMGRAMAFRLKASSIEGTEVHERILVMVYGKTDVIALGDSVAIEGKLRALDPKDSFDRSLTRRKITAVLSGGSVERLASTRNPVLVAAEHLRDRLALVAEKSLSRRDAGLLLGLTIGDERLIPKEVIEDFRATSLSHLTAVSGANVAMVLGALIVILRAFGTSKRSQIILGIGTVIFFAVITRWEPSVLRATVMSVVGLSVFWFGRRTSPMSALVLTFLLLAAVDPFLLWSIGFQLSFAAAFGIILLTPIFLDRLKGWPRILREALSVGLGAQIAVTPLLAFHFGRLSLVSIPANLVAFPLVAPITVLGMAAGAVGSLFPPAAAPMVEVAGIFVAVLRNVASFFADLPFAYVSVPEIEALRLVMVYALIGAAMVWIAGRRRLGRRASLVVVSVLLLAYLVPPASSEPPPGLRITFLDVGQGDAAIVQSPTGATVLIDGGPDDRLLAAHLRNRGIRRIDVALVSHFHYDHVAGLEGAFRTAEVRLAVHPGVPDPLMGAMSFRDRLTPSIAGDRFVVGDLVIEILAPDIALREEAISAAADERQSEGSTLNDASLVVRIPWAGSCILFTGDIEEAGQSHLVEKHRRSIDCTVMKAPHHGSARLEEEFVDAVDPEFVGVSVGRNTYGHPSPTAMRIFQAEGARVLRTDRDGDLILEVDGMGKVRTR